MIEIICGTFFIYAAPLERASFESLTDEQAKENAETYMAPEYFIQAARGIDVLNNT